MLCIPKKILVHVLPVLFTKAWIAAVVASRSETQ